MSATSHRVLSLTPFVVEFINGTSSIVIPFQVALTVREIEEQYDFIVFTKTVIELKKFTVDIHVYKNSETTFTTDSFSDALRIQQGASAIAQLMGWTRHSSCEEEISHFDSVFDLYNEGAIIVKRIYPNS